MSTEFVASWKWTATRRTTTLLSRSILLCYYMLCRLVHGFDCVIGLVGVRMAIRQFATTPVRKSKGSGLFGRLTTHWRALVRNTRRCEKPCMRIMLPIVTIRNIVSFRSGSALVAGVLVFLLRHWCMHIGGLRVWEKAREGARRMYRQGQTRNALLTAVAPVAATPEPRTNTQVMRDKMPCCW